MILFPAQLRHARDPIEAILDQRGDANRDDDDDAVLAVVAQVEGPSYRPLGAMMSVFGNGRRVGTLSSGCVEADIMLHAQETRRTARPALVRYGLGSPFMDIQLPCGGGLEIALLPHPDRVILKQLLAKRLGREACTLVIDLVSGHMALRETGPTVRADRELSIRNEPPLRFLIFGKGPEASTMAALVQSAGYPNLLLSPDEETLSDGVAMGCPVHHLAGQTFPENLRVDNRTAIVLFFHDHDWEPPLLVGALQTPAFFIGAQGSLRARNARLATMAAMGIAQADLDRLVGPVGLIASARDAGTLAVSVLAQVLDRAAHGRR